MPMKCERRPQGDGAADVLLGGEQKQHSTELASREAPDPIKILLDRLDAALARGGLIQVDGRAVRVRAVSDGVYGVSRS